MAPFLRWKPSTLGIGGAALCAALGFGVLSLRAIEYSQGGATTKEAEASRKGDRLIVRTITPGPYADRITQIWNNSKEAEQADLTSSVSSVTMAALEPAVLERPASLPLKPEPAVVRQDVLRLEDSEAPRPMSRPRKLAQQGLAAAKISAPLSLMNQLSANPEISEESEFIEKQAEVQLASLAPPVVEREMEKEALPGIQTPAPFGTPYRLQTASVQANCFPEKLVSLLAKIEAHYRTKVVVTSGFRGNGRSGSLHRHCQAADIIIPGVSGEQLATYARTLPDAGGVGRYCHPFLVHVDIGRPREWKYGCGSYFAVRQARS